MSQSSGSWRSTDRAGNAVLMTTPRFMADAVLLPDGTVLFVNGAAVGKADHSDVSVLFAELFDPGTETFGSRGPRPLITGVAFTGPAVGFLFLVDGRGVPSRGRFVQLR